MTPSSHRRPVLFLMGLGVFVSPLLLSAQTPWEPFVISDHLDHEGFPSVHGNLVVWETFVSTYGDWDIVAADITEPADPTIFDVANSYQNEMWPDVWGGRVVYELNQGFPDWDIGLAQIHPGGLVDRFVLDEADVDSRRPRIWADRVVWNDWVEAESQWDPALMDIADLNAVAFMPLQVSLDDEVMPDLCATLVGWNQRAAADSIGTLAGAGLQFDPPRPFATLMDLDPNSVTAISDTWAVGRSPDGYVVADNLYDPFGAERISDSNQTAAVAILDHLVVWQDARHGNWDLFGYNLATGTEFELVVAPGQQTNPALAACPDRPGFWLIWQDDRREAHWGDIYGMRLTGSLVARPEPAP